MPDSEGEFGYLTTAIREQGKEQDRVFGRGQEGSRMTDWTPPYYETECEHRLRSYHPVDCHHGIMTGTVAHPPTGRVYEAVLISG